MNKITVRKFKPVTEDGVDTYGVTALEEEFVEFGDTVSIEVEELETGFRWKVLQPGRNRSGVCEDVNDILPGLRHLTRMPDDDRYVILFAGSYYSPEAVFNKYFPMERFELVVVG